MKIDQMQIYQQGDLDSTCVLYSIANAYRALTSRKLTPNMWQNIINVTPSISQFLTYGSTFFGGTSDNYKKEAEKMIQQSIVENAFAVLSTKNYSFRISKISTDKIISNDFSNSVVIFSVTDKAKCEYHHELDHSMVIIGVDNDKSNFLLACSYTRFFRGRCYEEHKIENSKRVYNNRISTSQLSSRNIYSNYIYRVFLVDISPREFSKKNMPNKVLQKGR